MRRISLIAEALTDLAIEATKKTKKPVENFHSCRLTPPSYSGYAYGKCAMKHDGKCLDVVYGIKKKGAKGSSEIQAYRYDRDVWTAASARAHCKDKGGGFTSAKGQETKKE